MRRLITLTLFVLVPWLVASQGSAPDDARNPIPPTGRPAPPSSQRPGNPQTRRPPSELYTIEQSVSEQAQLNTIAFSGLAFMTGTFGADTFMPPGKVADYFGFQYMRDIDIREGGHNMMFLTNIAENVLAIFTVEQRGWMKELAKQQDPKFRELALKRLVLIKAFRENMQSDRPGYVLSLEAARSWTAGIFSIDGDLALGRAQLFGKLVASLSTNQQAALKKLVYADSSTWPELPEGPDKRSMKHSEHVLFMTYASEFFSWYAGSEDGDTYFCPERNGTYFGGFYMKDYPAMGNRDYFIPTELTGESGKTFLALLESSQREKITSLLAKYKPILAEMLSVRRGIAQQFRKLLSGGQIDNSLVMKLSLRYGELDGEYSALAALSFAEIYKTLTPSQKEQMKKVRNQDIFPDGVYIYAEKEAPPAVLNTQQLFIRGEAGR